MEPKKINEFFKKNQHSSLMIGGFLIFAIMFFALLNGTRPIYGNNEAKRRILIKNGFGLKDIAGTLKEANLIKSPLFFEIMAVLKGDAKKLKPGLYNISGNNSVYALLNILTAGGDEEVEILVPEGSTVRDIDKILSQKGVIAPNELINYQKNSKRKLEGFLFPDTYQFLVDSNTEDVVSKFLDNFNKKTQGVLSADDYKILILASLLEKELQNFNERRIVAGILEKRLSAGWPLQVDATVCYVKRDPCYPITPLDLKIDSPYNTYVYKGLPPTPISNPGIEAIKAAKTAQKSPYWFYLSHGKTGKTIFSKDLEEHSLNRSLYL